MEIIIGAVVVLGLLFLLGIEIGTLISVVQIILSALTFLMLLFFLFCVVLLLRSQKREAQLIGLVPKKKANDGNDGKDNSGNGENPKERIRFAHYLVDGEEYMNWFPAESIMTGRIYADKDCVVRMTKLGSRLLVFDRHSVVIVVTGTILMSFCTAGFILYWLFVSSVL